MDYKNIKLLRRYTSDTGKILPSRITSVCQFKQRQLSTAVKRAKVLGTYLNADSFTRKNKKPG